MADAVAALRLPPLREDIRLLPGPSTLEGAPTWTLHDPAAHRFLRIGWAEFEILSRWGLGDAQAVSRSISAETMLTVSPADVLEVGRFCEKADLLWSGGEAGAGRLLAQLAARRVSAAKWLLKNYLFLRIRLLDPDRLLSALLPWVAWAFHPLFPLGLLLAAGGGLYLVGRQWERFTHTLSWAFTLEGAAVAALALSLTKVAHEMGHGLAAKRFGCRVPAMGVALLVLWPVLWTDVTDAWKLTDRRQRLSIDAAGMAAEIILAVAASLLWAVLPDGPGRSAMFLLAGSTWLLTLAVNLNPLMRYDGYFLLSDLLDEPNLQDRSFALARWWLRERLFGFGDAPPENPRPGRRNLLVAYALAVWVYRFFLFLGIALLVYHLAFKLLGLFLMAVEIGWFILRPIWAELGVWRLRRADVRWKRNTVVFAAFGTVLLLALLLPWYGHVSAPALLRPERQTTLYTAQPGQVVQVAGEGQVVAEGTPLFVLQSPDLEFRRRKAEAQIEGLRNHLAGLSFAGRMAEESEVAWQELGKAVAELGDVAAAMDVLAVRAPFAGVVADVPTPCASAPGWGSTSRWGSFWTRHRRWSRPMWRNPIWAG
ncbi:MAG: hypothetical protein NVV74_07475 [Magnetospirillum sp.]|nr:hypothetical protein [Magnetospirillum sp.]